MKTKYQIIIKGTTSVCNVYCETDNFAQVFALAAALRIPLVAQLEDAEVKITCIKENNNQE